MSAREGPRSIEVAPSRGQRPSLHERILSDIEARIISGAWPPGTRIPFEHELTEQYACSRMTVNKALTQLANAGMIERSRKIGSFVKRVPQRSAVLEIHDIKTEIAARGSVYRYQIIGRSRRLADRADAARLDGVGIGFILEITSLHWADDQPFCLEERLINLATAPEADHEEFDVVSPGAWLLARKPWTNAEHRIRAAAANARQARLLGVASFSACLVVERRTWTGAVGVTHVSLTYPGPAHELVARFSPTHREAP